MTWKHTLVAFLASITASFSAWSAVQTGTLDDIKARGELRPLGG
jgi:hypothetical protein